MWLQHVIYCTNGSTAYIPVYMALRHELVGCTTSNRRRTNSISAATYVMHVSVRNRAFMQCSAVRRISLSWQLHTLDLQIELCPVRIRWKASTFGL